MEASDQQELTRQQLTVTWVTAAAVALTRLLALSKSLWDWDEALFCSALQEFNVSWTPSGVEFHPHPPGFPLFIALAHVSRLFTHTEFAALRAISTVAAMLLFPLMFALARSLRMTFFESYAAALIFVFLPNVWFYGGTGFSDIAAVAAVLAAAAALFASRAGNDRLYIAGCLLLGAAIGFRPQNALIGAWPWLAASLGVRRQSRRFGLVAAGAALVTLIAFGAYAGAALASDSIAGYIAAIRAHEHYVSTIDSFRNPDRPELFFVFVRMVFNPFFARKAMIGLWALAVAGVLSLRRAAMDAVLTFAPFAVFAWLMLDWYGASRLSLGFIAIVPLLAVLGVTRLVPLRFHSVAPVAVAAVVAAYFIQWTWPALKEVRSTDSPPVQATRWIRQHVDRSRERLFVEEGLAGQADYLLPGYRIDVVPEDFSAANETDPQHGWVLAEGATVLDRAIDFRRPHGRVWNIARHRFFELAVLPLTNWVTFHEGWLEGENYNLAVWRWMGKHSVTILPAVQGRGELRIRGHAPSDALPKPPVMTLRLNGQVLDRFAVPDQDVDKRYVVDTKPGVASELTIDVDQALNLKQRGVSADARELGFQLKGLSWQPAR